MRFKARWISESKELLAIKPQWERLQENAIQKNVSFEASFLLPAFEHLASDSVSLLVVETSDGELAALMPCEFKKIYGLPLKGVEIWKHSQCFDTTPLLKKGCALEAFQAACEFLIKERFALMSLDTVSAGPTLEEVLRETAKTLGMERFQRDTWQRAALMPSDSVEDYFAKFRSKNLKKSSRRNERRLQEMGELKYELHKPSCDCDFLTNEFLRIEASGWKGENGTALQSDPKTEAFFRELIKQSAEAGKARFLTLSVGDQVIAMIVDIRSGGLVYSYKTAFDEAYAKHSPGLLCELKNVELLHGEGIEVADSCTAPDNSTINRILGHKLRFQNVIFGFRSRLSKTVIKMLPTVQSVVNKVRTSK